MASDPSGAMGGSQRRTLCRFMRVTSSRTTRRRVRGLADDCGVELLSIDQETTTRPCTVAVSALSREGLDKLSAYLHAEPEDVREE